MANTNIEKGGKYAGKPSDRHSKLSGAWNTHKQENQPDWGRIDDQLLFKLIQEATTDDGAVKFGYSRDGGAYSLILYGASEPVKIYEHDDAMMTQTIINILEAYNG